MFRAVTVCAALLSLTIATAVTVSAQTPPPPSSTAPGAAPSAADKQAISKACSQQADAKGLHGKERQKFRSACKRRGGKPA
jgi:hypothetical protein